MKFKVANTLFNLQSFKCHNIINSLIQSSIAGSNSFSGIHFSQDFYSQINHHAKSDNSNGCSLVKTNILEQNQNQNQKDKDQSKGKNKIDLRKSTILHFIGKRLYCNIKNKSYHNSVCLNNNYYASTALTSITPIRRHIKEDINIVNTVIELPYLNNINTEVDEVEKAKQEFLHKNSRQPKQANHGARPCSSFMRRLRLKKVLNRGKLKTKDEV